MAWADSGTSCPLRKNVGCEDPPQSQGQTRPGQAKLGPAEQLPRTSLIKPGKDNDECGCLLRP